MLGRPAQPCNDSVRNPRQAAASGNSPASARSRSRFPRSSMWRAKPRHSSSASSMLRIASGGRSGMRSISASKPANAAWHAFRRPAATSSRRGVQAILELLDRVGRAVPLGVPDRSAQAPPLEAVRLQLGDAVGREFGPLRLRAFFAGQGHDHDAARGGGRGEGRRQPALLLRERLAEPGRQQQLVGGADSPPGRSATARSPGRRKAGRSRAQGRSRDEPAPPSGRGAAARPRGSPRSPAASRPPPPEQPKHRSPASEPGQGPRSAANRPGERSRWRPANPSRSSPDGPRAPGAVPPGGRGTASVPNRRRGPRCLRLRRYVRFPP